MYGLSFSSFALALFCAANVGKTFAAPYSPSPDSNLQRRDNNVWLYTNPLPPPNDEYPFSTDYTDYTELGKSAVANDIADSFENAFSDLITAGISNDAANFFSVDGEIGDGIVGTSNYNNVVVSLYTQAGVLTPDFPKWFGEANSTDGTANRLAGYVQAAMENANVIEMCCKLVYGQDTVGYCLAQVGWLGFQYVDTQSDRLSKLEACKSVF